MITMENNKNILVMGASGNQGNAVAKSLLSNGWIVHAMTRNPNQSAIKELEEDGAVIVQADMNDKQSLVEAMENVYGVYSVQSFDPKDTDKEVQQGKMVADVAKQVGTTHFVYGSAAGAEKYSGADNFASKLQIEEYIRALDLPYTILRHTFFMDNFTGFAKVQDDKIVMQGFMDSEIPLQMLAVQDIGTFTAITFSQPKQYTGKAMELAGEEITLNEIAKKLSEKFEVSCEIVDARKQFQQMMKMFEWFEYEGYEANIAELRKVNPQLINFDAWLQQLEWKDFT